MHFLASPPFQGGYFSPSNYSLLLYCISIFLFIPMSPRVHTHLQRWTDSNLCVSAGTQQWWCPSCTTPHIAPGREFLWWLPPCGSWPSLSPVPCCLVSIPQVRSTTLWLHLPVWMHHSKESSYAGCRVECEARKCSITVKFRVKIQSTCRLGSARGHEMQSKMGFKGAFHQFSMSDSIY